VQNGYSYVSVSFSREGKPFTYAKGVISYPTNSSTGSFTIPNIYIKAEPAEYECNIYLVKGSDSTLLVTRKHLVAGDFYVVNGQSNAYAFNIGNEPYYESNPYIRTFGINMGKDSDTLWTSPSPQVGAWALALQKYIIQNTGIPTCIINGAVP
jgi:hypothetical protein